MTLTATQKEAFKKELVSCLGPAKEIRKIVVFGSFVTDSHPHDLDVAVFQNSPDPYLALALKYRKMTRLISRKIPMDIIPLKSDSAHSTFLAQISRGEIVYEK